MDRRCGRKDRVSRDISRSVQVFGEREVHNALERSEWRHQATRFLTSASCSIGAGVGRRKLRTGTPAA
ncbi:MAG: hypothetical protein ACREQZ_02355, partial [Woeseiaceae bacterium]